MYPIYVSHICIPEGIHTWDTYMHPIGIHICIPYMYHICIDGIRTWDTYGCICIWDTCMDKYTCNSQEGRHIWILIEQEGMDTYIYT